MLVVSPCTEFDDEVMYHNYYQWVSYLLFIQSLRLTVGELFTNSVLTKFSWFFFQLFHAINTTRIPGERTRAADPRGPEQHHT